MSKLKKIAATGAIIIASFAVLLALLWQIDLSGPEPVWGLTFSDIYAQELGLEPRTVYAAILDELRPARMRLVAYWNRIEPERQIYSSILQNTRIEIEKGERIFSDLDWQVQEAAKRNIPLTLAVGYRTPRWPECHIPDWASGLDAPEFEAVLMDYLKTIVLRYRENPAIAVWQVENEPSLGVFGRCPKPDANLLKREVAFVRSLDASRPIMVTDSGELGYWPRGAGLSDTFGTTLYRYIWNKHFGSFTHIFPPAWYGLREFLTTKISGTKQFVIAELQAEPWAIGEKPLIAVDFDLQVRDFNPEAFRNIINFTRRTGISEAYLWGAEWWYWRKVKGDDRFWNIGKELFASSSGRALPVGDSR